MASTTSLLKALNQIGKLNLRFEMGKRSVIAKPDPKGKDLQDLMRFKEELFDLVAKSKGKVNVTITVNPPSGIRRKK